MGNQGMTDEDLMQALLAAAFIAGLLIMGSCVYIGGDANVTVETRDDVRVEDNALDVSPQ